MTFPSYVGYTMFSSLIEQMYREGEFAIATILQLLNREVKAFDMERARVHNERLIEEHGLSVSIVAKGDFEDVRVALVWAGPKAIEYALRHLSSPLWNSGVPYELVPESMRSAVLFPQG